MARGNDPGKDFDAQYDQSRRRGEAAEVKRLNDMYGAKASNKQGPRHAAESEGCADKAAAILIALGGAGWALFEAFSRSA